MPDSNKPESLLVADIGSVTTKVGLVDFVGSDFRFVAAGSSITTADSPTSDVTVGVRAAIQQIEARTERRLLSGEGQLISPERPGGQGVDAFVAITSAPLPLRVAVVGLSRDVSWASAMRAVEASHATVVAQLALDDAGGRWIPVERKVDEFSDSKKPTVSMQDPAVIAAESLASTPVDVIVLVGGIDGGATTPLYDITNLIASIQASRDENARPIIVFAGNSEARPQIANRIGNLTELRVVENVRPTLDRENLFPLERELENIYVEKKVNWLPGLTALTQWTPTTVTSTARAFENVVRFLARRHNINVLGIDLGGAWTTVVSARKNAYASFVRANLGLGQGIEGLIRRAGIGRLMQWLPLECTAEEAQVRWLNQTYRPWAIPSTRDDAHLMQAAARMALATAARDVDVTDVDLVLLTGGICTHIDNFGALALLVLDALQPSGIFTLATDSFGLVSAFGGMAAVNPEAAASVIERDGLVTLGTVIAPLSNNRDGQVDVRVRVKPVDAGMIELEVQHGSLELIPLTQEQKASIEIRPTRGVELGRTKGGIFKAEVEGGALGLIIDARGRPVNLPSAPEARRTQVQKWYWDLGGEVANG
ncbi:MAG: glutamate mutase L [Chloroflexi bacterium]|nr:glutamate mutase L [Chloroflexota bacterium]